MTRVNKRAFTLVELIMVMAVIAILVTVLFVSTKPQKRFGEANDAKRKNDAQSLEQAIKVVAADAGSLPAELNLTENQAFALVKAGGLVSGTYSCTALGSSINKVDISAALASVLPAMPMDPDLSADSNETGYYIIKKGRSYDIEPCSTYALAATSGDKQMCGDGYCGSIESCSTCSQDCGTCSAPAGPCDGKSIGQASVGGALCAGSYNGFYYMTTPGGCTDSSTPVCAGGADTVTKYYQNIPHAYISAISDDDGVANTNILAARADTPAAKYCQDMEYGSYTDWFLPSKNESNAVLYTNKTLLGGFANFYWTSTESHWDYAWYQYFGGGGGWFNDWEKTYLFNVRCVRKF